MTQKQEYRKINRDNMNIMVCCISTFPPMLVAELFWITDEGQKQNNVWLLKKAQVMLTAMLQHFLWYLPYQRENTFPMAW